MEVVPFSAYVESLGPLNAHVDPMVATPESNAIKRAALSLGALDVVDRDSLATWVSANPNGMPVLGLAIGLSQERLKNFLRHAFGTSSWTTVARSWPSDAIQRLDADFGLVHAVSRMRFETFHFGDILVARAGSRVTAGRAGAAGRLLEDDIESIAVDLGLKYQTRTRFSGRNGRTAPCDLVIPDSVDAAIVVAAKGFDSTGSKLTDAVREIEEMADVRLPRQFVIAVIDGIGWKSRQADLRRIHSLWETSQIDGMYTRATLPRFAVDLEDAARLRGLLPSI